VRVYVASVGLGVLQLAGGGSSFRGAARHYLRSCDVLPVAKPSIGEIAVVVCPSSTLGRDTNALSGNHASLERPLGCAETVQDSHTMIVTNLRQRSAMIHARHTPVGNSRAYLILVISEFV
jgi:hypothetical protein